MNTYTVCALTSTDAEHVKRIAANYRAYAADIERRRGEIQRGEVLTGKPVDFPAWAGTLGENVAELLRMLEEVTRPATATAVVVCRTCGFENCPGARGGDCPRWPATEPGPVMTSAKNCQHTLSFWAVSEYEDDCPVCGWRVGDHREPAYAGPFDLPSALAKVTGAASTNGGGGGATGTGWPA